MCWTFWNSVKLPNFKVLEIPFYLSYIYIIIDGKIYYLTSRELAKHFKKLIRNELEVCIPRASSSYPVSAHMHS